MAQKYIVSAFVGALALVGAQAAFAADWIPAGAAASMTISAPATVVSTTDTSSTTQVASWAPAGAAASEKQVAVASNTGH